MASSTLPPFPTSTATLPPLEQPTSEPFTTTPAPTTTGLPTLAPNVLTEMTLAAQTTTPAPRERQGLSAVEFGVITVAIAISIVLIGIILAVQRPLA